MITAHCVLLTAHYSLRTAHYGQVLQVFSTFEYVQWPPMFTAFIAKLNIDIGLSILPLECIANRRLSFFDWLLATMLSPFVGSALLLVLIFIAWSLSRRHNLGQVSNTPPAGSVVALHSPLSTLVPALCTLHIWLLLLLYPTLSRNSLAMFDCSSLRGLAYLRDDPEVVCFGEEWYGWLFVALTGITAYAVGIPLGVWLAAWRYHRTSHGARKVSLLLASYKTQYWWFECCDLTRKLVLTSVITLVAPNSKRQLWFGLTFAVGAALVVVKLDAYRDSICFNIQTAVLLQVGSEW